MRRVWGKMKPIFEFSNYKSYIKSRILISTKTNEEIYYELSCSLGVTERELLRVLEGEAHIAEDSLIIVCMYFGLDDLETRYLSVLLLLNQAVSWQEIDRLCGQLDQLKHEIIDYKVEQTTEISVLSEIVDCA